MKKLSLYFLLIIFLVGGGGLTGTFVQAKDLDYGLKIFDQDFNLKKSFFVNDANFKGLKNLDLIDLGGDGQKEILVSYGEVESPLVKIFRGDGSVINFFQPYPIGFKGIINMGATDFDNDKKEEIITVAGAGGGPQVRIFDGYGQVKFTPGFFVADKAYRQGVNLTVLDVYDSGEKTIAVTFVEDSQGVVKFFNHWGQEVLPSFKYSLGEFLEVPEISFTDLEDDGAKEILINLGSGNEPLVKVFKINGQEVKSFLSYGQNFLGGVELSYGNLGVDRVVVTGTGFGGGAQIRFFKQNLDLLNSGFFAYDEGFRGGVDVVLGDIDGDKKEDIIALPKRDNVVHYFFNKYIKVDISEQKLSYWQYGFKMGEFIISSGLPGMDTPVGEFKVLNKNPRAYSGAYNLYMPWWMEFTPKYGLHELPEWANGYKEGVDVLGKKASHGCVRLGVGSAEVLYNWAEVGTPVIVHD